MQIFVKRALGVGTTVTLNVSRTTATVQDVVDEVARIEGLAPHRMYLYYDKSLEACGSQTLLSLGVADRSTLRAHFRFAIPELLLRVAVVVGAGQSEDDNGGGGGDANPEFLILSNSNDTVLSLKSKIAAATGVEVYEQSLTTAGGVCLSDARAKLADYKIENNSLIHVVALESSTMQIFVSHCHRGGGDQLTELTVRPGMSIDEVKTLLQPTLAMQPVEMRLVYGGRDLLDGARNLHSHSVPNDGIILCKGPSAVWSENNFALNGICSFLSLADSARLLLALSSWGRVADDVKLAPADHHIATIIKRAAALRASRTRIRIEPKNVRWVLLQQQQQQQQQLLQQRQTVKTRELRMLHSLVRTLRGDVQLAWGRCDFIGNSDCGVGVELAVTCSVAVAAGAPPPAPGALFGCKISARCVAAAAVAGRLPLQAAGTELGLELDLPCKRCLEPSCPSIVLQDCSVCNNICSACSHGHGHGYGHGYKGHAASCAKAVCPGTCVVSHANPNMPAGAADADADAEDNQAFCTNCRFQCLACFLPLAKEGQYACAAGTEGCLVPAVVCQNCVDGGGVRETIWCTLCGKEWCDGCPGSDFPECSFCDEFLCSTCAEMSTCARCKQITVHESCVSQSGARCSVKGCAVYCCSGCEDMTICSNPACRLAICGECHDAGTNLDECAANDDHNLCKLCIPSLHQQCLNEAHSCVPPQTSAAAAAAAAAVAAAPCKLCWLASLADSQGFAAGIEQMRLGRQLGAKFAACLKGSPLDPNRPPPQPQLHQASRIQCWMLCGRRPAICSSFNDCSRILDTVKAFAAKTATPPFAPSMLISPECVLPSVELTAVFGWSGSATVIGLSTCNSLDSSMKTPRAVTHNECKFRQAGALLLKSGERIVAVHVRASGSSIVSIRLVTSMDREVKYGSIAASLVGEHTTYRVPRGSRIVGFFGDEGNQALHSIGVVVVAE